MHDASILLDLVIVLGTAALTTALFHALRQPIVLGYLLAGLLIGPSVPHGLSVDSDLIATLSELGVILLMFSIGLEFSVRTIARMGLGAGLTASVEVALLVALGYLAGLLLGWTSVESLFAGACAAISSTMLVARTIEREPGGGELVVTILVFEDLLAILLLAILTEVASGASLSGAALAELIGRLTGFLAAILVGGLLIVPRAMRWVARLAQSETLVIAALAICFGMATLAAEAGYSIALGAFLAGLLVAESGHGHDLAAAVRPFRDVFAAVFFVSIGMSIDPRALAAAWPAIVVLTVLVVAGKAIGVTLGAFLAGHPLPAAIRAALTMAQVGELSFVIAGVGIASGATGGFLLPVFVGVSCLTAFVTPWLSGRSARFASWIDRRLPGRVQTFVTFYGTWIERLGATPQRDTLWRRIRGPLVFLLLDAGALAAIAIAASFAVPGQHGAVRIAILAGVVALGALFLFGVFRCVRTLARVLAAEVIPAEPDGTLDLGRAPRRALFLTLELAIVLVVGVPTAAIVEPFVPAGGIVLGVAVLAIALPVWRAMSGLHGHARAGSALIVEALTTQTRAPTPAARLDRAAAALPGFAGLEPVEVAAGSAAAGKNLAQLDLRARTGATVLVLTRAGQAQAYPSPKEPLRAGDVLALSGSDEAIAAARALLSGVP